jgi:hypothetical protein
MAHENIFAFYYAAVRECGGILSLFDRAFRVPTIYFDTRSNSKRNIAIKDMMDFQKSQKRIRRGRRPDGPEAA